VLVRFLKPLALSVCALILGCGRTDTTPVSLAEGRTRSVSSAPGEASPPGSHPKHVAAAASDHARREVVVKKGDTLWMLGVRLYGNRHFARVIALHNNITDPTKLRVGLVLRVPDLKMLLVEEGLCETAESEVDAILRARALFRRHGRRLVDIRRGTRHQRVVVPEAVADDLREAAKCIDSAITWLRAKKSVEAIPQLMIGQLENFSRNLKELAGGSRNENNYDLDMVHQRLVHAIYNGIKWARSGFR